MTELLAKARSGGGAPVNGLARGAVDGIVLLDKPVGLSSNRALQRVKALFRAQKAGHTGSLDPLASGMLPLCLGQATKLAPYLLDADKEYRFRLHFGVRTTTGDLEGMPIATGPAVIDEASLRAVLAGFVGDIDQVPPMFSALKQGGQPLYKIARAGGEVARRPRRVRIFSLDLVEFDPTTPLMVTRCSKGTYIRTLAEDLARRLGTEAHLVELRRLSVAGFCAADMVPLETLLQAAEGRGGGIDRYLQAPDHAVKHLPKVDLSEEDCRRLRQGQAVHRDEANRSPRIVRLYGSAEFLGMGLLQAGGWIKPLRLMTPNASATYSGGADCNCAPAAGTIPAALTGKIEEF